MCVIIQGNKKLISKEIIEKAFKRNAHGFGLMYISRSGELVSKKFFTKKLSKINKTFFDQEFKNIHSTVALHFRYTTAGETNNFNCHPFKILSKEWGDKFNLSLMHNSPTITSLDIDNKKSDTWHFVHYYLKPIFKKNPDLLFNQSFIDDLETLVSAHCDTRVLLLNDYDKMYNLLGNWNKYKNLVISNNLFNENFYNNYRNHIYYNNNQWHGLDNETSFDEVLEFNKNKEDNLKDYLNQHSDLLPYGKKEA